MLSTMRMLVLLAVSVAVCSAGELDQFAFLTGCWSGGPVHEVWMKPEANMMLGMTRTVKANKVVGSEFMRIEKRGENEFVFAAQPKWGGPVTDFKLIDAKEGEVVFSNPAHDFPQRVIYRKQPDGSLLGRIEGTIGGKERSQDFRYKKVACE